MSSAVQLAQAVIGAGGLVAAALGIWYLDEEDREFEETLTIKIAAATTVFSAMMMLVAFNMGQENFLEFGPLAFPSLKVIADAITLGFLASALKDLLEREMEDEE